MGSDPAKHEKIIRSTLELATMAPGDPHRSFEHQWRGIQWHQLSNYDCALADYEAALRLTPGNWQALFRRGVLFLDRGELDRAEPDLKAAMAAAPDAALPKLNLAALARLRGQWAEALKLLDQAIAPGTSDTDEKRLDSGDAAHARYLRAYVKFRMGNYQPAMRDADDALLMKPGEAHVHDLRGQILYRLGDKPNAIAALTEALRLDPRNATYLTTRGALFSDSGDLDRALEDYESALVINPRLARALNNRGSLRQKRGDYARALPDFEAALAIAPDYTSPLYNRALIRFVQGGYAAAAADFETLARPRNEVGLMIWAYLARARTGDKRGDALETWVTAQGDRWPAPMVNFVLGRTSLDELNTRINRAPFSEQNLIRCEMHFYDGQLQILAGNPSTARSSLGNAMKICTQQSIFHQAAKADLERLN